LDEIEKAHTEVSNVLLQLLDDGRLTDGQGRTVDFRNTVVIMTSNLGSGLWGDAQASEQANEAQVRALLSTHFRPEFLNRIDEIVVFRRLSRQDLAQIVEIQLRQVAERVARAGYRLEVTPAATAHLAEVGFDPLYGARPLKRAIQRELQDPLALRLLSGDVRPGDTVLVDLQEGTLRFTPRATVDEVDNPRGQSHGR
jgi:ATP-dependent Clp protease ATP-binding subunit ClpB